MVTLQSIFKVKEGVFSIFEMETPIFLLQDRILRKKIRSFCGKPVLKNAFFKSFLTNSVCHVV
jgi:hypothetical protein